MSSKRSFGSDQSPDQVRDNPNAKRMCTSYPSRASHSVSIQLSLNQLMLSSKLNGTTKLNVFTSKANDSETKKCFNCQTRCQSVSICCNFCDRNVCDDCCLHCFRCSLLYCRLCAVKCYEFSHQNNIGVCLSCDS